MQVCRWAVENHISSRDWPLDHSFDVLGIMSVTVEHGISPINKSCKEVQVQIDTKAQLCSQSKQYSLLWACANKGIQ